MISLCSSTLAPAGPMRLKTYGAQMFSGMNRPKKREGGICVFSELYKSKRSKFH